MYCSYFVVYWCLFCLYSHAEILFMIKVSLLTVSHGRSRTSLSDVARQAEYRPAEANEVMHRTICKIAMAVLLTDCSRNLVQRHATALANCAAALLVIGAVLFNPALVLEA